MNALPLMKMQNIDKIPVHPDAAIWPMIDSEELAEMAQSIAENGQLEPIIIASCQPKGKKKGLYVIDGRNRLAACQLAGVEPWVEERDLAQDKISVYIKAWNAHRRHMPKGQKAMALAMMNPEGEKGGRGKKSGLKADVSSKSLQRARIVLKHLPDLAQRVLDGYSLNKAYDEVQDYIKENENDAERMERLKSLAPDIAERVANDELSLNEGFKEHEDAVEKEKTDRLAIWLILRDLETSLSVLSDHDYIKRLVKAYAEYAEESRVNLAELASGYIDAFEKTLGEMETDSEA